MSATPLITERVYDAPANTVWDALTQIDQLRKWYFQLDDFKAEPGFKFTFTGKDNGNVYIHLCEVKEVIPGRKITYSWVYEGYPGYSEVSWELFPEGNKTKVLLTHRGLESFNAIDNPSFQISSFQRGWGYFLNEALLKYLDGVTVTQ
ncbi:MAG: SRPBCC domain-containing protein [Chitinophaga sp.]|uniref:SRPBCC family protein n=1 Tax=Chitinophaga sp. TaxID=1869181 RepID=UPI0025B943EF|nr:SRPBCC domain-containing protein [Chitinophaga sp.]MBV8255988.1 SRPBCC domain-containing protein [Chitinophaga sp.]